MAELIPAVPVNYDSFTVPAGQAVGAAMRELNLPNKGPEAVVVVRGEDGTLFDLSHTPDTESTFTPVAACEEDGRAVIRHSCGHVMAQAVQAEFPGTKLGIGPAIENGFYFDFQTAELTAATLSVATCTPFSVNNRRFSSLGSQTVMFPAG